MISEMTLIFEIANFPLLGGDVRTLSYGVYQLYISSLENFKQLAKTHLMNL